MPEHSVQLLLPRQCKPKKKRVSQASRRKPQPSMVTSGKKGTKSTVQKEMVLEYRPRQAGDDPFILELTRTELGTIHQQTFGEPFPEIQFLQYLRSGAPTVVVMTDSDPIGYYSYLVGGNRTMHITALVLKSEFQSQGLGTKIMQHLETEARKVGIEILEVFVQDTNHTSLDFTKNLGFHEVFRVPPRSIAFHKRLAADRANTAL